MIGLDGATWNVIDPLIKAGKLPYFNELIINGSRANLKSCIPYITSPAWKCLSTGLNPGQLGVYHWLNFNKKLTKSTLNTALSFTGQDIWSILGKAGYKVGTINMPQTWPPSKVNGFMISGMHALDWSEYTYPPNLKNIIIDKFNYKLYPNSYYTAGNKAIVDMLEKISNRFEVANELIHSYNVDFLNLTIYFTDTIQHYYWKQNGKEGYKSDPIENTWARIDMELNQLLSRVSRKTNILIVSDHGMDELKTTIRGNEFLMKEGLLFFSSKILDSIKIFQNKLLHSNNMGLPIEEIGWNIIKMERYIKKFLSEKSIAKTYVGRPLITPDRDIGINSILKYVDWENSKAIILGEGLVYITIPEDTNEYKIIKQKLIRLFSNLIDPYTKESIVEVVTKDDTFFGNNLKEAPDLVLLPQPGYLINDRISVDGDVWNYSQREWTAFHILNGIFIGNGPNFKANYNLGTISIYDIAPTILSIYQLPPLKTMNGQLITSK